ncbi:MAG: hypothetical protein C3F07_04555 [Anaerolineales bacterium]|nr:hypothetical protein [Anaerolineae bacterium]PWB75610.1 MAG: hypothetical protein C3F07_04555 [Anaerolineales bacterium]
MSISRSQSAKKAWETRRKATYKATKSEKASKIALASWCQKNGWKIAFFEGKSGAPRTGIVDAVLTRIKPKHADIIEIKLVQLKTGAGGLTAREIVRLKKATSQVSVDWSLAAYDGENIHFLPEIKGQSR